MSSPVKLVRRYPETAFRSEFSSVKCLPALIRHYPLVRANPRAFTENRPFLSRAGLFGGFLSSLGAGGRAFKAPPTNKNIQKSPTRKLACYPPAPKAFNKLGRLLSLSRHLQRAQHRRF
jgi:hypothetical protein